MSLKRSDQSVLLSLIALALATVLLAHATSPAERQLAQLVERLNQPIDLNRATIDELMGLPGIGPVLAGRVIEYRETHGGFRSVEELLNVRGIGPKRLAQIRERLRVEPLANDNANR